MSNIAKIIIGGVSNRIKRITEILEIKEEIDLENLQQLMAEHSIKRDLLFITPLEGKKTIGVEQISDLIEFASKRPLLGSTSTVIIFPAEKLGLEPQNKLLKLLEEPPLYLQIYLLADASKNILPTVLSRCQIEVISDTDITSADTVDFAKRLLSKTSRLDAYLDLDERIAKMKPIEKYAELSAIINAVLESVVSDTSNTVTRVESLHLLLSKLHRATKSNVNPKLILDRLFLGLQSIE